MKEKYYYKQTKSRSVSPSFMLCLMFLWIICIAWGQLKTGYHQGFGYWQNRFTEASFCWDPTVFDVVPGNLKCLQHAGPRLILTMQSRGELVSVLRYRYFAFPVLWVGPTFPCYSVKYFQGLEIAATLWYYLSEAKWLNRNSGFYWAETNFF